jgi:hypothetical protein
MPSLGGRDERIVHIATAPNEIVAALWKGALEEEGIPALVKAGGPGSAYFTSFAADQLIFVLESDAARARDIVESLESAEDDPR